MNSALPRTISEASMKRSVFLLFLVQALAQMSAVMVIIMAGLVGKLIAPAPELWTLALTTQFIGTMFSTIPANIVMRKIGRKAGFTLGQISGVAGGALSAYGIVEGSFTIFCIGGFVLGIANAVAFYYRFAAAEVATDAYRSRAISYVMAGGIVAAFLGSTASKYTKDLMLPHEYLGGYLFLIVLSLLSVAVIQFLDIPELTEEEKEEPGRPISEIVKQPLFIAAVMAAAFGFSSMSLIMIATPLAMEACGLPFDDSAFVINWHFVAMYLPSFFTGYLIRRFGVVTVICAGIALMVVAVGVNLSGLDVANFFSGLALVGVGWNFMFVGGTTLLTETYTASERNIVQAVNDFVIFGFVALASLLSGVIQAQLGWVGVNFAILVPMILTLIALYVSFKAHKKHAAERDLYKRLSD